jgi:hypothetical protein
MEKILGKKGWSFFDLENMKSSEFEKLFEEVPSDPDSDVDADEEDAEDPDVLEEITHHENPNVIEENLHEININVLNSDDGEFSSEDELPLSEVRRNLPFDIDRIRWESINTTSDLNSFTKQSGPKNIPDDASSPFDVFSCLFPEELISHITKQTNLYALQKFEDPIKFKKTTNDEIKIFLGINVLMGIKRLPSIRDYYSSNDEIRDHYISSLMSRNRLMWILGNVHLNDNKKQPKKGEKDFDKLYKVRPFLDKLLETFQFYYESDEHQSVDESMIKFKGRSSLRQYMPQKPIKRGYKIWVRANQSGYISEFQIYTGKVETAEKHLGTRVVKDLTQSITGEYRKVYFDNYFSSMPLMHDLKERKLYACGTVRKDRKGLPNDFKTDKMMKRGDSDWRMTEKGVVSVKWMDKKGIHFLSNFHDPEQTTFVQRRAKDGTSEEISCPELVKDYNQNMGHVDKADMLKSCYEIDRKSKRWWLRIFWHFIDVTIVNAFILFRQRCDGRSMELKEFRIAVARGLIGIPKREKRGRKSDEAECSQRKYKRQVPLETRYVESSHMPMYGTSLRCASCSTKSEPHRTKWRCTMCKVGLCLNDKKNCFVKYHQK